MYYYSLFLLWCNVFFIVCLFLLFVCVYVVYGVRIVYVLLFNLFIFVLICSYVFVYVFCL